VTTPDDAVLAPAWWEWLADNLAHGLDDDELFGLLEQQGVPRRLAVDAAAQLRRSPAFAVARAQAIRAARLACVLRLVRARAAVSSIERRRDPAPDEFFGRYWAAGVPFVATDLVAGWPARGKWSPQWLRERFGAVEIEASVGRESDPEYDINFASHRQTMTMAQYVDRVLATEASNDCYLIANNHNLARPGLRPLFDDIVPPAYLDASRLVGGSALWFGPAGTTTSLHHDTSNILLCQIYGTKTVRLGDPCDPALVERARGVYSEIDPLAEPDAARLHVIELGPGDALFLPVGWWHHVTAHDVSISIALNAFARPNRFDWYTPGALRQR
jgi:hypothetical protein